MKKVILKIACCCICILLFTTTMNAQTSVINVNSSRQVIRGFGGMNFPRWIGDLTTAQADKAFGNGAGQLGFSILRISVSPQSSQWNLEVPTAQRAASYGAIILATPWSPPASMKTNNSTIQGQLRTDSYGAYANYLRDFANYMSSNGAPLYAVSVQNEPDWLPDYESCGWNGNQLRDFVKYNASVIPTRVLVGEAVNFNKSLTDPTLNDAEARNEMELIGTHLYGGGITDYPLARQYGKEVWMTEHLVNDTDWNGALATGKEIHDCMTVNFSAYIWWYIRRSYGPIDESGNVTKRGYVMSQFSKFVRPGYTRVDATASPTSGVSVTAYTNGTTLVIVALNQNSSSRTVTFDLSGTQVSSFTKYETTSSANVNNSGTVSSGTSMTNTLSASSITTYVGTIGGNTGGGNTSVWLEAECGTVGSLWNVVSDGSSSHNEYVSIQSGNNSTGGEPGTSAGYITYPFNVGESGNYAVWGRVIAPNGNDDSFWVRMDNGSWTLWNNIEGGSSWHWDQVHDSNNSGQTVNFNLSSGNHTLTIAYREDGTQLDKIFISNTGTTPSGEGSSANNCSSSCTPTSITPYIQVNGGSFVQTSSVNVTSGSTVVLGPQPTSGGSWSWTGCGTSGSSREQTFTASSSCTAVATYTNSCGAQSTQSFNITVNGSSGGTDIWLEAECGNVGSLWNTTSNGSASAGNYVTIQSGNNSTGSAPTSSSGQISYSFNISQSGNYVLWARVIAPTPDDDSFWVQMDNGSWFMWNNITASTSWTWDDCQTYNLGAGNHTLVIAYREDGTQLDKINITSSGNTPSGTGSAATNCSSASARFVATEITKETVNQISLSPNPATEKLTINLSDPEPGNVDIVIYSTTGATVRTTRINKQNTTIDISEMPSGIYIVKVNTGNASVTKRLVKK